LWHLTDLGADSASKSEYQDIPGSKGGRCVRLTTYHFHVPFVKKSGGLNLMKTFGPVQACNGTALPFTYPQNIHAACKRSANKSVETQDERGKLQYGANFVVMSCRIYIYEYKISIKTQLFII